MSMARLIVEGISFDRLAVEGRTLFPENVERFKEVLTQYNPWLKKLEVHMHETDNFTLTLTQCGKEFLRASIDDKLIMLHELARRMAHFFATDTEDMSVLFTRLVK